MKTLTCFLVVLSLLALPAQKAQAASETLTVAGKKTMLVAKAGLFGLGGGLVIGLASQVFKNKPKNIFLAGSLGMYAGIAMGLYIISSSGGNATYEGPDTYEDYQGRLTPETKFVAQAKESPVVDLRVVSLSF